MTAEQLLHETARRNNYKMPDEPFDANRLERAKAFSNRIMAVIGLRFGEKDERWQVDEDLICAAYIANAKIVTPHDL